MAYADINFETHPESVASYPVDCVWVVLGSDKKQLFDSELVQWIDWKLQGEISRMVIRGVDQIETTFIPTMNRLASAYVVIDTKRSFDPDRWQKRCEGLKLKSVLLVCDPLEQKESIKSQFAQKLSGEFSCQVDFAVGPVAGDT